MRCGKLQNIGPDTSRADSKSLSNRLSSQGPRRVLLLVSLLFLGVVTGCGTTKQHEATAQLLESDAVDMAIAKIDFTPLAGQKVYLDTQYVRDAKNVGFVNTQYVISSLRQQMVSSGILLYDDKTQADLIVEPRLGTLGTDENEVVYGVPKNNLGGAATGVLSAISPVSAAVPTIPEISIARRNDQMSAVKVGMFAYDVKTREPVWQSGLSMARSTAKDMWFMGAGPFQRGTIYDGNTRFAGTKMRLPLPGEKTRWVGDLAHYREPRMFKNLHPEPEPARIELAESAEPEATEDKKDDVTQPATEGAVVPASAEQPAK